MIITFGKSSILAQLFFMNFTSILLLFFVGWFRPFASNWENVLEMLNEYTILLLYCQVITQTDFVPKNAGRFAMGWSMIILICLNIALNLGSILVSNVRALCRKLKLHYLKKASLERHRLYKERQQKIILHRQQMIAEYNNQNMMFKKTYEYTREVPNQ